MFPFPVTHFGDGIGSGFLDDIGLYPNAALSVCGQIAAGVAASIANDSPVSEEFLSVIANPKDGTSKSDSDFFNGTAISTDGDELALSGPAGTSTNFLSGDGTADIADLKALASGSVIESWHRTDTGKGWMVIGIQYDLEASGSGAIIGNESQPPARGVKMELQSSNELRLNIRGDTGLVTSFSGINLSDGSDQLLVATWDASLTTNNVKFAVDSDTFTSTQSTAFNTSTSDSTSKLRIFARPDDLLFVGPDTRVYGYAWGNDFISNATLKDIRDWFVLNTPIA